jgi:uncharacterized DUF497 family protein
VDFDRDENKNLINIEKHYADFNDAKLMFNDDLLVIPDTRVDYQEHRYIGFGYLNR